MTEVQQRRIVYFFGAGASLGAGAYTNVQGGGRLKIPTQETFWDIFLRFCAKQKNRKTIERFLFRYFLGYSRVPARADAGDRRALLKVIDVEEVFTFLSERIQSPATTPQFRAYAIGVWDALLEEIGGVFRRFGANAVTRRNFKAFRDQHLKSRDTIVSFNYDTVFEYSLPSRFNWYYEGVQEEHVNGALRIHKPHGSINWERDAHIPAQIGVSDEPKKPVIVAPTHLKFVVGNPTTGAEFGSSNSYNGYLDQSPQLTKVWAAMEREMREAKGLVFIGYSFPVADLYFSSVLRSVLAARETDPFVIIVNPIAAELSKRVKARFAIREERIRIFFDLQTFVQVKRSQLLAMFKDP